jgi:hypothetical protein
MNLTLFNDFIIGNMNKITDKKDMLEKSKDQITNNKNQQEVDMEIHLKIQRKKEEKEALKKMLGNLKHLQNLNKQHNRKNKN